MHTTVSRTRRDLVLDLCATAMSGAALGFVPGVARAVCSRPTRIRSNINDPNAGSVMGQLYLEAVGMLKALPSSHKWNWLNLANIHRDFCPHGNWYFLPWHRAYLLALEDICAQLTQRPDFALPYWDWSTFRQIPRPFVDAQVNGASNPLFHQARGMGKNDTLTSMLSPFGVDADRIFGAANIAAMNGEPDFQQFGSFMPTGQNSLDAKWQRSAGRKSKLEREPHDYLHGAVGGDMGNPMVSAKDPIFYLHHCNIDRLWDIWNSAQPNSADQLWGDFVFKGNFPAETSVGGDVIVSSLSRTADFCYGYDTNGIGATTPPRRAQEPSFTTLGKGTFPAALEIAQTGEAEISPNNRLSGTIERTIKAADDNRRILAFINDVTPPKNKKVNVRVFLNCDYLTPLTPADDPHYAGGFTFFVMQDHEQNQSFAVDLTQTVRQLGPIENVGLRVQLMPVAYDGKVAETNGFSVGSIEIVST